MKKVLTFLSLVLALTLLCPCVPAYAADAKSGECGENAQWSLSADGVMTVSGSGEMYSDFSLREHPYDPSEIKTVVIESGVSSVSDFAFSECENLEKVSVAAGVREIGMKAFGGCPKLSDITLGDGIERIAFGAFAGSAYLNESEPVQGLIYCGAYLLASDFESTPERCEIKPGTTLIADGVFMGNENMKSISLPASMAYIGNSLYGRIPEPGCTVLEEVNVDGGNGVYSSQDGVLFSKDRSELILYPAGRQNAEYKIPDGVTKLGRSAFSANAYLENAAIPASVKSIGDEAFRFCELMTEAVVPEGVESIGSRAFSGCAGMKKVSLPASLKEIGLAAFAGSAAIESIAFGGSETEWQALTAEKEILPYTEKEVVYSFGADTPADPSDGNDGLLKLSDNTRVRVDNAKKTVTALPYVTIGEFRELLIDPPAAVSVRGLNELPGDSRWLHTGDHIEASDEDDAAVYSVIVLFDVNCDGKVSSADARLALRAAAKVETLNDAQLRAATRGASDKVTAGDARSILRVGARLETVSF